MPENHHYKIFLGPEFINDLRYIRDNHLVDPEDWGLFQSQIKKEEKLLNDQWENNSKPATYPPLSTYGYRKRYFHSIPEALKIKREWDDRKTDFRIIFKVNEEKGEIYYHGIGKRIKGFPKDPSDIWSIVRNRKLPEED